MSFAIIHAERVCARTCARVRHVANGANKQIAYQVFRVCVRICMCVRKYLCFAIGTDCCAQQSRLVGFLRFTCKWSKPLCGSHQGRNQIAHFVIVSEVFVLVFMVRAILQKLSDFGCLIVWFLCFRFRLSGQAKKVNQLQRKQTDETAKFFDMLLGVAIGDAFGAVWR